MNYIRGPWEHILLKVFNDKSIQTIRKKFIKQVEYRCVMCDNKGKWFNKPLTLEMDHIDGNRKNNHVTNLRLMCPNCHSQTDTYKKRKIIVLN